MCEILASPFEQNFLGLLFNQNFSKRRIKRMTQDGRCTSLSTGTIRDLGIELCT